MSYWYFVCGQCEAKWFADLQVCDCPRCGTPGPAGEKLIPPWKEYLTVEEAAEVMSLGLSTVYAMIDSGKLPCHDVGPRGGSKRIKREDLQAYLDSCRRGEKPREQSPPKTKLKHLKV